MNNLLLIRINDQYELKRYWGTPVIPLEKREEILDELKKILQNGTLQNN